MLVSQSKHSVCRTEQKFLMTYETYKMAYEHRMTIFAWRTEWGCSHPIKSLRREHFSEWYLFWFCKIGVSPDKTGGAVLSAEGSDKTENSVPRVLLASRTSHSLFCFCFCRRQGSAWRNWLFLLLYHVACVLIGCLASSCSLALVQTSEFLKIGGDLFFNLALKIKKLSLVWIIWQWLQ